MCECANAYGCVCVCVCVCVCLCVCVHTCMREESEELCDRLQLHNNGARRGSVTVGRLVAAAEALTRPGSRSSTSTAGQLQCPACSPPNHSSIRNRRSEAPAHSRVRGAQVYADGRGVLAHGVCCCALQRPVMAGAMCVCAVCSVLQRAAACVTQTDRIEGWLAAGGAFCSAAALQEERQAGALAGGGRAAETH